MALEPITRQEQIVAGKDLEPITRMERFLKEYGGVSSWDDLSDKPFGTETTPDFVFTEEDIANPTERLYPSGTDGMSYNKVSEKVFTPDELNGMSVTYIPESASEAKTDNSPFIDTEHTIMPMGMVFSGADDGTAFGVVVEQETDMGDGCVFSTGLWIVDYGNLSTAKILTITIPGKETIKRLDEKYMPILTSPNGKKFKLSVDDSGTLSTTEV